MSFDDIVFGTGMNPDDASETQRYPDRFYTLEWCVKNHPINYYEERLHRGYLHDDALRSMDNYRAEWGNIITTVLNERKVRKYGGLKYD